MACPSTIIAWSVIIFVPAQCRSNQSSVETGFPDLAGTRPFFGLVSYGERSLSLVTRLWSHRGFRVVELAAQDLCVSL